MCSVTREYATRVPRVPHQIIHLPSGGEFGALRLPAGRRVLLGKVDTCQEGRGGHRWLGEDEFDIRELLHVRDGPYRRSPPPRAPHLSNTCARGTPQWS